MRPRALFVEEPSSDALARYRLVFEDGGRDIEHVFIVKNDGGIDGVNLTDEYWRHMPAEPFTKLLCESLIRLHQAIRVVRSDEQYHEEWESMMRPTSIFVEEPSTDALASYRIVFDDDGKQVEHIFTVSSDGEIDVAKYPPEYWGVMPPEPFTKWLCESLIYLHQAIRVVRTG